jgi:hypothetical protein
MYLLDANARTNDAEKIWIDVVAANAPCGHLCSFLHNAFYRQHSNAEYFAPTKNCDGLHAAVIFLSRDLHVRKLPKGKRATCGIQQSRAFQAVKTGDFVFLPKMSVVDLRWCLVVRHVAAIMGRMSDS